MQLESHSNELLEAIVQGVGAGVVAIDGDGVCLLANKAAEDLLGKFQNLTIIDRAKMSGFFLPDRETPLPEELNPFARAMRGEYVEKEEIFLRNSMIPVGGWCTVNIRPLLLKGDNPEGITGGVIIIENITERRLLADEAARSNRDLQQFAYVAAHDLQEPLRTIVGFSELLEQDLKDHQDEDVRGNLKRVIAAARRMQALIAGLLAYARIETRAKPPQLVDSNQIMRDVIADFDNIIESRSASVTFDNLPEVVIDPSQLSQLFSNLIGNALKYSKENPEIRFTATTDSTTHHFCCKDNGIGIDMQFAERIFVIFQRLHNKSQYEGVGIGLALCKKIVEAAGGRIWIQSQPEKGTEVHFILPVSAKRRIKQ